MNANLTFPTIIDDYKNHLRKFPENYLSFESFCQPYHIRVATLRQWMHRRGLDLSTLYYEVLLERSGSDPDFVFPGSFSGKQSSSSRPTSAKKDNPDLIKGASITFPDGVVVAIRQTTCSGLTKFIESYNKLIDKNYAQPE